MKKAISFLCKIPILRQLILLMILKDISNKIRFKKIDRPVSPDDDTEQILEIMPQTHTRWGKGSYRDISNKDIELFNLKIDDFKTLFKKQLIKLISANWNEENKKYSYVINSKICVHSIRVNSDGKIICSCGNDSDKLVMFIGLSSYGVYYLYLCTFIAIPFLVSLIASVFVAVLV